MSDMADQYYLAWVSVFDNTPRKLCTWHVDRAWRGGLQQHIKGMERQAAVYSQLRVLLEELDLDKFTILIDKVCTEPIYSVYIACFALHIHVCTYTHTRFKVN